MNDRPVRQRTVTSPSVSIFIETLGLVVQQFDCYRVAGFVLFR